MSISESFPVTCVKDSRGRINPVGLMRLHRVHTFIRKGLLLGVSLLVAIEMGDHNVTHQSATYPLSLRGGTVLLHLAGKPLRKSIRRHRFEVGVEDEMICLDIAHFLLSNQARREGPHRAAQPKSSRTMRGRGFVLGEHDGLVL